MPQTRFCIARHGETTWNAEKRIQGHIDVGLNAAGLAQAEAAANWLAGETISAIYSSDLQRARQTAQRIAAMFNLVIELRPEFRERRYGLFEGRTYEESREAFPEEYGAFERREPAFIIPGGESLEQLNQRVCAGLRQVASDHPDQTVVVVTHGGVLDIINRLVRGTPLNKARDFLIPNASISWIRVRDAVWQLECWGQTQHLAMVGLDELP
ncbi:MAG TPA: histidine phosphatase family protein [Accumulibacter sp.]|nr:histidine phosphatase family protein [Accumulibacter sp.]HMW18625.1 histidine phosphatase family protein [Accumulibacter sp.]HMX22122.1 histidine phosphatase family protein [Accumulibacter sp.]HNC18679.1 histidine phosphatase family protein [Accumulibacter sp.]HND81250.1 histidine phosphatase family protein [Accumulibacter sp.]